MHRGCVSNSLIVDKHFDMVNYRYNLGINAKQTLWLLVKRYRY